MDLERMGREYAAEMSSSLGGQSTPRTMATSTPASGTPKTPEQERLAEKRKTRKKEQQIKKNLAAEALRKEEQNYPALPLAKFDQEKYNRSRFPKFGAGAPVHADPVELAVAPQEAVDGAWPCRWRVDDDPMAVYSAQGVGGPGQGAGRPNFGGLVLGCIDADFCKQVFVGKLLTKATRFTYVAPL